MRLRPHHLLCTQGYSGKGYSPEFVKNMDAVVRRLRTEQKTPIELVFSTDDLCSCCPDMLACDITPEILEDICGGCSWYPVSACRKNITGKK